MNAQFELSHVFHFWLKAMQQPQIFTPVARYKGIQDKPVFPMDILMLIAVSEKKPTVTDVPFKPTHNCSQRYQWKNCKQGSLCQCKL